MGISLAQLTLRRVCTLNKGKDKKKAENKSVQ
jgi:hypothetical protein